MKLKYVVFFFKLLSVLFLVLAIIAFVFKATEVVVPAVLSSLLAIFDSWLLNKMSKGF